MSNLILTSPPNPSTRGKFLALLFLGVAILLGIAATFTKPRFDVPTPLSAHKTEITAAKVKKVSHDTKKEKQKYYQSELELTDAKAYILRFQKVALIEQQKFGIPASISLAQGLIESNKGKSFLAEKANNHFGIKCTSKHCSQGHCVNRTDDTHKDFFRNYPSAWESWRAHSNLLQSQHYSKLRGVTDYKKYAQGLQKLGYATDPNYAKDLVSIIEQLELYQHDKS